MTVTTIQHVIGTEKDAATLTLTEAGYKVRIVNLDGPPTTLVENFDRGRVTLEIQAGKVVSARVG